RLITAAADLVDPEIDKSRPPPAGVDRRLVLGLDEAGMTRRFIERQRFIVDLVARIGRAGLEVRLELERWHFHHRLSLSGNRRGLRTVRRRRGRRPFRDYRLHPWRLGRRGRRLLERWGLGGFRSL